MLSCNVNVDNGVVQLVVPFNAARFKAIHCLVLQSSNAMLSLFIANSCFFKSNSAGHQISKRKPATLSFAEQKQALNGMITELNSSQRMRVSFSILLPRAILIQTDTRKTSATLLTFSPRAQSLFSNPHRALI